MDTYSTAREVEKPKRLPIDADVSLVMSEIAQEVMRARAKFKPFNSAHEGYAVILEEVDELWDEVKKQYHDSGPNMRKEALQIAAMAVRFLTDVTKVIA